MKFFGRQGLSLRDCGILFWGFGLQFSSVSSSDRRPPGSTAQKKRFQAQHRFSAQQPAGRHLSCFRYIRSDSIRSFIYLSRLLQRYIYADRLLRSIFSPVSDSDAKYRSQEDGHSIIKHGHSDISSILNSEL